MKKNLRYFIIGFVLLFISLSVSRALIQSKPKPKQKAKQEEVLTVKTVNVKYDDVTTYFTYQGYVNALEQISLSAEVNGKILQGSLPFKEGQDFQKNTLLIKIYNEDAAASLKASRSNFLRTLSMILPDMMVDYPESYEQWKQFFNTIHIDESLPELPEINNEKEKIFLASQNVLSEYYALKQQEITFSKYEIYAPFDGYFKQVNREVGSIAANGVELAVLVRSDALEVMSPVFPADAEKIIPGQSVQIENKSGHLYNGKVSRVAQFVDQSTQSVNVYVRFEQSDRDELLEGEFVSVNFENSNAVKGISIPREALIDKQYVYQVNDNQLEKVKIQINQVLEDVVIISGLEEGSTVVTESLANVREGMKVATAASFGSHLSKMSRR